MKVPSHHYLMPWYFIHRDKRCLHLSVRQFNPDKTIIFELQVTWVNPFFVSDKSPLSSGRLVWIFRWEKMIPYGWKHVIKKREPHTKDFNTHNSFKLISRETASIIAIMRHQQKAFSNNQNPFHCLVCIKILFGKYIQIV